MLQSVSKMKFNIYKENLSSNVSTSNCRMASVISKMGFVFFEQGFHSMLVPICISISVCCSGTGFYYQVSGAVYLIHFSYLNVDGCASVIFNQLTFLDSKIDFKLRTKMSAILKIFYTMCL